jgi:esterase
LTIRLPPVYMQLHYKSSGEGPALIILHGLFGSSDNWLSIAKELSADYTVYLPDQRNHGRSPRSDQFDYAGMSQDLLEFIEEHQLDKPMIMGHSMGGKTAMYFALRHPDKLSKLIVVDIAPRHYPVHHDTIIQGLQSVDIANIRSRQEADEQLARYEPHPTVRMFLLKNLYREGDSFAWRINLPVISAQIENVGEAMSGGPVTNPTLFINGVKSDYIRPEDMELIHRLFPNAEHEEIAGAGHWVHAEKPEEFLKVVRKFIAR